MKKTTAILLIILILLNIYIPKVNASDTLFESTEPLPEISGAVDEENFNQSMTEGTATTYGEQEDQPVSIQSNSSLLANITKAIFGGLFGFIPALVNSILSLVVSGNVTETFTIEKLLTNQYSLFDIDFFHFLDEDVMYSQQMNEIKQSVANWYVSLRNIVAVGMVLVLIYVGIRMAISTVADQKAKYKKMLIFWLEGLAFLFLLQYFIIILFSISRSILNLMINAMNEIGTSGVEESIVNDLIGNMQSTKGVANSVISIILTIMMVYYELKFFIMYLTRVLRIAFYMVISPLICLYYPIDKIGDGRAQAFRNWFTEYTMEIFLQCIHLGLYMVFMFSAGEIMKQFPLLGVVFLATISNGEKIIKNVLKIKPRFARGLKETKLPGQ